jgi:hypothetical protein
MDTLTQKIDTLNWTETELQCKYCEHSVFFNLLVLIGMLQSSAKTLVKLNGVIMWLVYAYALNVQGCQWGICYVELWRLCAVLKK